MGAEFITIARATRTQGRCGEVAAELHTDFPERFAERRRLFALAEDGSRRELELESFWPHKGGMVLKFRGVDSISAAQELVGCELQVRREERAPLAPGSAYVSDLVGCVLWDSSGGAASAREVGRISEVQFGAGEAPLLVIEAGRKQYLVPFAAEFLRSVDLGARRVEMKLPEGLLEVDAPLTAEEKREQQGPRR